ncbi:glycogen synthase [Thalassotalea sp. ND16A]|uniref:glycogen synthase n=1 Tax=Thalassotalea sp. ND16A TaxID=1535422 RepID=UPI00051A1AD5|nr:glycogen/starch synthase [Thalassotalea sp. ND16A]KGJ99673.1 Starch synthase [Thalassotalea sp. ND16A]
MKILMAAAENDALAGGKVGGIADVVRDIPLALANIGQQVDVVMPGYGRFSQLPGAQHISSLQVMFAGQQQSIDIFKIKQDDALSGSKAGSQGKVTQWVIEHPLFAMGGNGKIYCDDPDNRPFATDATKFALFSAALAKAIISQVFGDIDVLHLHDWHAAMVSVLRAYDPEYQQLQSIKTVYTIHNLALQGIRPIDDDESSLKAWFPNLPYQQDKINDPRYPHCFNPMRAGINLSDKVHAVSPTYAKEILIPSNSEQGYFGGEGLEDDLRYCADSGRLHGILNGCEYPEKTVKRLPLTELMQLCEQEQMKWLANKPLVDSAHLIAMTRIKQLASQKIKTHPLVLTSVGRITDQKVRLFHQRMSNGETALEQLLTILGDAGVFILLGSGDSKLENFLTQIAAKKSNFIFLKGYSAALSENMYSSGDLFLMPSSFEPCGISQMLSMRAGQPCLAHSVGGLSDTINHDKNGFTFNGDSPQHQTENMLRCFQSVLDKKQNNPKAWNTISTNAFKSRFLWRDVAEDYLKYLYSN